MSIFDEEEKEENGPSDEKSEKIKNLIKKIDSILPEAMEAMIDKELRDEIEDHAKKFFAKKGLPYTSSYIKAWIEGVQMALQYANDESFKISFLVLRAKMVKDEDFIGKQVEKNFGKKKK